MKLGTKLALGLIFSVFTISAANATENCPDMHCDGATTTQNTAKKDFVALANKRLSELKDKLNITKEQEPAWQIFADKVNTQAHATEALHEKMLAGMQAPSMTTPDRMAMMADIMKVRAQHMATMAEAVRVFYNTLSPQQKASFEKMHISHMHAKHG
ncbi:MAG: Spy/CpxP family protein refolding chaperone [Sulfuriferula sp.]